MRNGTKVVIWSLIALLCHCATYVCAAAAAEGTSPEQHDSNWPIGTVALAIVMVFYTWWLQVQHRRRMEQANEELKRAFEALRESETKFRLLFERSADAILLIDPTKGPRFTDCNDAAVQLLGYRTKEEIIRLEPGGVSTELQPDGQPSIPKAAEVVKTAIRNGSHRFEWRNKRADGQIIITEVAMTAVQMAAQPLIVTVARDVTERKGAEEALRQNQQLLASVLENISEGIYRSSPERGLIFANKAYLRMFGYESLQDLRSIDRENLYADPADRKKLLDQLERTGAIGSDEILYKRKNGTTFWGLASSMAVYFPGTQSIDYHVGAITDITDRKSAEDQIRQLNQDLEKRIVERTAELQESEARMRTLVEHAPEAIVVFDAESGKFTEVNENATKLYGRSRQALLGLRPTDVSPELQADGTPSDQLAKEKIEQALGGEVPVFEWLHNRPDGKIVPCEIRLVRLPSGGEQKLIRASIIDTSERRRKEKIQQATYQISEAVHTADDLKNLYERIHSIIKTMMPAENFYLVLHHPETGLFHFDYHVDLMDPRPAPRVLATGLNAYVIRTGRALLASRESMVDPKSEWKIASGTPSAVWLGVPLTVRGRNLGAMAVQDYTNAAAYGEEEKQILTFVAGQVASAIQRKRAEQALRESEEKHRALFQATSQGVMLHDEKAFLEINPAALRILGYERAEEIIGKHPSETSAPVQPNGDSPDVLANKYIAECMEKGTAHFEWLARTAKGNTVPLEIILTRIQMGGKPLIQAVILDITERKEAESELLKSLAREKELSALKSNFVSMVSHEFRTPLGVIMSSSEILETYFNELQPAERIEHLDSIKKNTRRMADLMEEVLLLSRVEAGRLSLDPQPMDLAAFCRRLVDEVLSATNRRCPIEVTLEAAEGDTYADERLLQHILINLLTNAVKYSPEGMPVQFFMTQLATRARFEIQDHGIGIPEQDQKWIFNAFQRGRNVGNIPGTGLGLVIVKRCVELHRGTILMDSAVGRGTKVAVEVPVALATLAPKTTLTLATRVESSLGN
ncbi:MAG: PAS domain S-box protein [Limisphaerales bacterium]